jgi:hypothetical protein
MDAGAFTWGYNIDFLESEFDVSDGIDPSEVALMGHEVTHIEQYRGDGSFTAKYLLNYVANLGDNVLFKSAVSLWVMGFKGIHKTAYRSIHYEEDAYAFQEKVTKDIGLNGNPCDPASKNGKKYGN